MNKILDANIQLAAQVAIQTHIIRGLNNALKMEKKKRQRDKAMNLVGEEDSGPQFFSPGRIQRARDLQNEKEAHAQAERERIAEKKVKAAVNKA